MTAGITIGFLLVLLIGGCTSAQTSSATATAGGSGLASVCTDDDREYAELIGWGAADEAYEFGLKIQEFIKTRDIKSLFGLVAGELENGPRRRFIQDKSFSKVFSDEWRQRVLSEKPECRPVGWRGYMLGSGSIWFRKINDRWSIFSINGASVEAVSPEAWSYDGALLTRACFTNPWISLDNYEEYREQFGIGTDFAVAPGRYIGGSVPLAPIVPSWGGKLSLAIKLSECMSAQQSGDVEFVDGWVHMKACNDECLSCIDLSSYCPRYRVLKRVSRNHCRSLAPNFSNKCIDLRLVETVDPTGGTLGDDVNFSIFGIIEDLASRETYVMPLINFDNLNTALNYVDALE